MKSPLLPFLGFCCLGLLAGLAAGHFAKLQPAPASPEASSGEERASQPDGADPEISAKLALPEIPQRRSTDTLESLAALDGSELYGRLAPWLMDATETEIAAYWERFRQTKSRSRDIEELIFLNWTRLDPHAAVAAGGEDERYPWWAWACHDPKTALAEVLASNPKHLNDVTRGIGEFHPDWLRAHFDEIPEEGRSHALYGMRQWGDAQNPAETLDFLREKGMSFEPGTFKALVRKDPWAAYDWLQRNPGLAGNSYDLGGANPADLLVSSMVAEHPEALARLAEQTPSGELRRKMEAALFEILLAADPEAALERAKASEAPRIAAQFLGKIGLGVVRADPEKAFEMAAEIIQKTAGAYRIDTKVAHPRGSSTSHGRETDVDLLLRTLLAQDPARVMDLAIRQEPQSKSPSQAFHTLSSQWSTQDLAGYTAWVNLQDDPAIREPSAEMVAAQLVSMGQFSEAAEWAMSAGKSSGQVRYTLQQWWRADPEASAAWLEAAELPAYEKANLKEMLERHNP